jgi:hypothetical protein
MAYVANPPLGPRVLLHALAKHWWLLLLRGICAILFGVLAFVWPGITLLTLVLLYGAFALVDGVLALAEAVMGGAPAPLVARACRTSGHRRRNPDIRLAGHHCARAALVHRRLGDRDRGPANRGRDQAAQGDRQRVAADRERRTLGHLRIDSGGPARNRRVGLALRHRYLRDPLRYSRDLAFAAPTGTCNELERRWSTRAGGCRVGIAPPAPTR